MEAPINSGHCIDHNKNHVDKEESCFVGYGEDESSQPKKIDLAKKWKLKEDDITEFLAKDSNWDKLENVTFMQEMMGKFFTDGELKGVEFPDKHSALDTLRSILQSVNRNRPDLWEWLEHSSVLMESPDEIDGVFQTDGSSHRDSNGSSSLGILSYSEMSSFSTASYDGVKNDNRVNTKEKADTTELIGEIEELHHQNKRLNEERSRLAKQIAQTEDSNNQLVHENDELLKRVQSLQNVLDKLKGTEKDHDDVQSALVRLEEINQQLQSHLLREEKENREIGEELKHTNHLMLLSQTELDNVRQQLQELSEALNESEMAISAVNELYNECLKELKEKNALLEEKESLLQ